MNNNIEPLITDSTMISGELLKTKKTAAKIAEKAKEKVEKVVLQTDLIPGEKPLKPDVIHQYLGDGAIIKNAETSVRKLNESAAVKAYSDIPPMPL